MEYFVISLDLAAHLAHLHKVNDLVLIVSATLGELCQPDLLAVSLVKSIHKVDRPLRFSVVGVSR